MKYFKNERLMMTEEEARNRAKELLNENQVDLITKYMFLEQQCKKQKEVINKAIEYIRIYRSYQKIDNKDYLKGRDEIGCLGIYQVDELLDILKEATNNE